MSEHQQAPHEILTARRALIGAAELNLEAVKYVEAGSQCMAAWTAAVALSLSTYALAMYKREAP